MKAMKKKMKEMKKKIQTEGVKAGWYACPRCAVKTELPVSLEGVDLNFCLACALELYPKEFSSNFYAPDKFWNVYNGAQMLKTLGEDPINALLL